MAKVQRKAPTRTLLEKREAKRDKRAKHAVKSRKRDLLTRNAS